MSSSPPSTRLASMDAYRGFVMFLMLAEALHLSQIAKAVEKTPGSWADFWAFLAHHQSHVEWVGCSLHDLIQPSFSFLVGVALPFSLANRFAKGQALGWMMLHAAWRSVLLIALGVFLRSFGRPQTFFQFEDTLCQIGLGYFFLFLLGLKPMRDQWIALVLILLGYGVFFANYPKIEDDQVLQKIGISQEWKGRYWQEGFAGHWNKNANPAREFDVWFLNQFPREQKDVKDAKGKIVRDDQGKPLRVDNPYVFNQGGYQTLSFIPTLGTMILGLLAGGVLRSERTGRQKFFWLLAAGGIGLLLGWGASELGWCPAVKRIWTPSWVLFSGGWCFLLLAGFYGIMDLADFRAWAFPLTVIGMNSIAAYCMGYLRGDFVNVLERHLGKDPFLMLGPEYQPLLMGGAVLLAIWLILFWMYRNRIFVRI